MDIPQYTELFNPTLDAIRGLGGSGSIHEIAETVVSQMQLPDSIAQQLHGNGPQTELEYRLAWARTYLKAYGMVNNSQRRIWSITDEGNHLEVVNPDAVRRFVVEQNKRNRDQISDVPGGSEEPFLVDFTSQDENLWRDILLEILRNMDPAGFERLCQRLLRESGFIDVEVTGRSGDGGIDGRGIIRFAGLIGFPVLFQCKRYASSVTPSQIRDFRGAMTGRADRGLVITTGGFTRDAQAEATRDGAPPIDLIDGNMLVEKLRELELGVTTKQVEVVDVDAGWFSNI